jgi:pimeloyl-ACP methyl ester carboxylesterase
MTTMTETAIHPFQIHLPDEALDDLRRRIAATRLPNKELVSDRSQGVQLATIQTLPGEIFRAPRSRVEKSYPTLTYFNKVDKGGHFAAWEEPELFSTEVRAAFRSLR